MGTSIKGGDVKFRGQKVGTSKSKKKVGTSPQVGTSKKVGTSIDVPTFSWDGSRKIRIRQRERRREGGRGVIYFSGGAGRKFAKSDIQMAILKEIQ